MTAILYNSEGVILGAFDDPTKTKLLDGQMMLVVDLTNEQIDDLFSYTIVSGGLVRKAQSELDSIADIAALKGLRLERNKLLAETDWWVLPDRTPTQAQLDYRQALRDITDTYTSINDVVWPVKPEQLNG